MLYRTLNERDPNASSADGLENLWGGSGDIGGSPRATGSALSGAEILAEIEGLYGERRGWMRRAAEVVRALQHKLGGGLGP
ncbi:MAG: hypothetical protein HZB55_05740 [Deltaproteobacteria bacterium]|nr:hypothetical protein [Deltaproteobacteria bacterium]